MKRTTKKSASKKTAKRKATKKVARKKVVKRKRNPERFQIGKSYVFIPNFETRPKNVRLPKYMPFKVDVIDIIKDSEGVWLLDDSAEMFEISMLSKYYDIEGPFTKREASDYLLDLHGHELRDMYRMQHEM